MHSSFSSLDTLICTTDAGHWNQFSSLPSQLPGHGSLHTLKLLGSHLTAAEVAGYAFSVSQLHGEIHAIDHLGLQGAIPGLALKRQYTSDDVDVAEDMCGQRDVLASVYRRVQ
jgi:hypothetical protein